MHLFKKALFILKVFIPIALTAIPRDQIVIREHIVSPNTEDFDCHSSSLIEVSPGILCAAWKGGPGKGQSNINMKQNVGIWLSFFKENHWNQPEEIFHSPDSVCWSPVLHKGLNGELTLFFRVGKDPRHTISLFKRSFDRGLSWSKEEILPAGIVGPTKTKPLIDKEGNIICGSSIEVGAPEDALKATACWIEILSDHKWSKHGPLEIPEKRFGAIEPALFFTEDGTLKLLCRDRSHRIGAEGWIWTAESHDRGKTWSKLSQTALSNPDSGIDVLTLPNHHILLFYNNSPTKRYPLSVALSKDGGISWDCLFNLEEESGEFPSATLDSQGLVHVCYAWIPPGKSQKQIKHVVLEF